MNKLKTILLALGFTLVGFLTACSIDAKAEQTYPLKIWKQNDNGYMHTWNLIDEKTGVNYIVVSTERGNGEMTCAITPRLNADGSLYIGD